MTSEDDNKQSTRSPGISSPSPKDEEGSQDSNKMEDTSPGVVRDSATIEPRTAPGLGDDTKNGMASRPRKRRESRALRPSAGDDSRRQTDGSEDKEEKGIYTVPCNGEKCIKTNGETSETTGIYTGPSAGDDSRRQTDGSEVKEEEGMYAEPSKEESSCRQTEPNTRDANASPDGNSLAPRGAAFVLSRTLLRVRGPLTTFPEETSDAEEPGAPSRDSTNPVLDCPDPVMAGSGAGTVSAITKGSTRTEYSNLEDLRPDSDITPVSTAAQIDAISRGDMAELPDSRHVDIEERHYSIWLVGAAGAIEPAPDESVVWGGKLPAEAFSISLGGVGTPWVVSNFALCAGDNVAGNIRTFRNQPWCFGFLRSALREARFC
ncbi:hypothetical protein DYB30_005869 [Aphanomyces astaci]|uniref:Uncharacterized protein n=1 Tax=Aphanomyces astaci TaxID=112090 RepID=A0A397D0S0_APHAT|nr:hypothetical protein DYB30_005869 [Aphanomyces astaci]